MGSSAKRLIKLSVSIVFFAACWAGNVIRRWTGRVASGSSVIIYYHGIRPDLRSKFAEQMDMMLRWTTPVDLSVGSRLDGAGRYVAVTFDDGFVSFLESALPELEKRKITSTLFVVAERLGCYPEWDEYIEDPSFKESIMTREQLLALPPESVVIGSHTLTHPFLTRVTPGEAKRELRDSRVVLEKMLGRKVSLFSFPHGDFNDQLVEWCRESGYEHVYTILPEASFCDSGKYVIGRVGVNLTDWRIEFLLKILGAYSWLPQAFTLKRRLLSSPAA